MPGRDLIPANWQLGGNANFMPSSESVLRLKASQDDARCCFEGNCIIYDYMYIYIYMCVCVILYSHIIFPWEEDGCRTSDELFTAPRLPMLPGHGQLSMGPMSVNDVCVMVPAWCHGFNPEQKQRPFTQGSQGKMLSACRKGAT